tara:strand:+ start:52739 stop:53218 length:480 start_codon:yes stop_codon:yes gene_type:complete
MPKVKYSASKGLYQEAGSGIEFGGNSMSGMLRPVRSITTADAASGITFGAGDSGIIISIASSTGGVACVLPSATTAGAGWYCDVCYAADTPGGNVTFTGGTFKVICIDGGAATEASDSGTTLTFATAAAVAGDRARIFCDGTLYYVQAGSSAGSNITAA